MNALLLDFVIRWRWVLLGCLVASALSAVAGTPFILAPAGAVLLLMDAHAGGIRVTRCLPIPLREHARFCWIAVVLLVPAASALVLAFAGMLRELIFPAGASILFGSVVQVWVGIGYAAACFVLITYLPTRPTENWREHITGGAVGALWGLSIAGIGILLPHLPTNPRQVADWHWLLFILSPLALLASIPVSDKIVRNRSTPPHAQVATPRVHRTFAHGSGLCGIPLFLATIPGHVVVLTTAIYLIQSAVQILFIGSTGTNRFPLIGGLQAFGFGIMLASIIAGGAGIRALRVLPLSTGQLAALLLAPALGVALLAAAFGTVAWLSGTTNMSPLDPPAACIMIFGIGAMGVAVMLRYGNHGFFLLMAGMVVIMPVAVLGSTWHIPLRIYAAPVGLLLAISGYYLVVRILRSRSEAYQARRMLGANLWQPQSS